LSGLDVFETHALPVEKIAQPLGSVPLVDTLTSALADELVHEVGELVHRVFDTLHPPVDNVNTVILRVFDELLHVAAESRKIGCDGRNTHDGTLCWSVSPWFVVGGKDTHVGTTNKVVVVHWEDWVTGRQELWMEDDLDTVRWVVEELTPSDLVQDWVLGVINHVVSDNWWEVGALQGIETTTEHDLVLWREKILLIWRRLAFVPHH